MRYTFQWRNRDSFLCRPSSSDTTHDVHVTVDSASGISEPVREDLGLSKSRYTKVSSSVIGLFLMCYELTVSWFIVLVIIFAVNLQSIGVSIGECPSLEGLKAVFPFQAYIYASASVVLGMFGISCWITPSQDSSPYAEQSWGENLSVFSVRHLSPPCDFRSGCRGNRYRRDRLSILVANQDLPLSHFIKRRLRWSSQFTQHLV